MRLFSERRSKSWQDLVIDDTVSSSVRLGAACLQNRPVALVRRRATLEADVERSNDGFFEAPP